MSSSSLLVSCVLCASSLASEAAVVMSCPETYRDGQKVGSLVDASVFDGAPTNLAELMPDLETSEWDISMNQAYAEQHGESVYLVCRYKGIKKTVQLKIPYAATRCVVKGAKGGGTYAGCSPMKSSAGESTGRK